MSKRYVFGLYDVEKTAGSTTTTATVASSMSTTTFSVSSTSSHYLYNFLYNYSSLDNLISGTVSSMSGVSAAAYTSSSSAYDMSGKYYALEGEYFYGGSFYFADYKATSTSAYTATLTVTAYKVTKTTTTTSTSYSQGTTFYNYLYGSSSSSYTTGRQTSGTYSGYWITYVGTDSITPTLKITKSGYKMTSTITASSSATYGGDIYYLLETACNERDYETAQDSQTLTYTETVDSDTVYYYSRVTAYCDGFTDSSVTASYTISQSGTRYVWDQLDEEGGTSSGYVTSNDIDDYPLDGTSGSYYYDYLGSDTPDATAVTATTTGKAGATVTLKITAAGSSANVYGGTIYYKIVRYRRSSSSGSYTSSTVSSKTTSTTVTTTIPTGGYYDVYYTVTTLDSYGYVGTTAVSTDVITIINNEAPTVTITDIGTVTDAFDITFAIADEDGDEMDVTLALDGTTLTTWSDQTDGTLSYTIDSDALLKLLNGSHTVTVTVTDSSETTTATATFTKAVYTCSATWNEAKTTDGLITKLYMGWVGSIPDDATVSMLVTNDNGVTWEDASDEFLSSDTYTFSTSSADTTAFNFNLTITRGDTEGYIDDIMFVLSTGDAGEYGNTVCTLTHIESNGVHTFSGLNGRTGMIPVQFKSTSANTDGDTDAELDGEGITLQTVSGGDVYWLTGRGIMAVVDTEDAVMTLQM